MKLKLLIVFYGLASWSVGGVLSFSVFNLNPKPPDNHIFAYLFQAYPLQALLILGIWAIVGIGLALWSIWIIDKGYRQKGADILAEQTVFTVLAALVFGGISAFLLYPNLKIQNDVVLSSGIWRILICALVAALCQGYASYLLKKLFAGILYYTCPYCEGRGFIVFGKSCPHCRGTGNM